MRSSSISQTVGNQGDGNAGFNEDFGHGDLLYAGDASAAGGEAGTSNTPMFHDDLIGWDFTRNTKNPAVDGDDGIGSDDGILAATADGTAHQRVVIIENVVEVIDRGAGADTVPETDWLLL